MMQYYNRMGKSYTIWQDELVNSNSKMAAFTVRLDELDALEVIQNYSLNWDIT